MLGSLNASCSPDLGPVLVVIKVPGPVMDGTMASSYHASLRRGVNFRGMSPVNF